MNFQLVLSVLRARFGVFACVLVVTVAAATVISLLMPKTYTATVSLLVDARDEQSFNHPLRPLVLPQERVSYLQTQVDIIRSEKVVRKVVRDLDLAHGPLADRSNQDADRSAEDVENALVADLLKNIKIETSQSSVAQVNYSSRDAAMSAAVANAVAKAYIETMLELRVEPTREAAAWFDEQLKSLRANLEQAQASLTAYYQKRGIVTADERSDVESTQLEALVDQFGKARDQAFQWGIRERQAQEYLANGGTPDRIPEVLDNPFVQRLKADLLRGEAKLRELSAQYGEKHPSYQGQLMENQSLRERLDAEMSKVLAATRNSASQSRQRESDARAALSAQRARVLGLKEGRNELTVLRRNVDSAERAYDTAMQRYVVSRVESRANQTNVAVLNSAVVPSKPAKPRIALNIALSVVVGTLLGIGAIMVLELMDRRVRLSADLQTGVPLLAVLDEWKPAARQLTVRKSTPAHTFARMN